MREEQEATAFSKETGSSLKLFWGVGEWKSELKKKGGKKIEKQNMQLFFFFLLTALLRHISNTIQYRLLKWTSQWFLLYPHTQLFPEVLPSDRWKISLQDNSRKFFRGKKLQNVCTLMKWPRRKDVKCKRQRGQSPSRWRCRYSQQWSFAMWVR